MKCITECFRRGFFYQKNVPQARFFMKLNVPQSSLVKPNAPQDGFFD